jgi:hypothetical protein
MCLPKRSTTVSGTFSTFDTQKLTSLGTTGKDIEGPEKNSNCGIHHWSRHGIAGRGVLIDYWTYANETGKVYGIYESFLGPSKAVKNVP